MIEKHFLIPECYVLKVPMCDDCNEKLINQPITYTTYPQILVYKCPKCNKIYEFKEFELQGEWKWRTI